MLPVKLGEKNLKREGGKASSDWDEFARAGNRFV